MQRGNNAGPILAFNMQGTLLRSWGKGDFTLPLSLRIDPEGKFGRSVDAKASRVPSALTANIQIGTPGRIGSYDPIAARGQGAVTCALTITGGGVTPAAEKMG